MSATSPNGSPVDSTLDGELTTFSDGLNKPPPGLHLAPGLRIGPYVIEREIGRGGMGTVYLASRGDQAYEKKVAVKIVSSALGSVKSEDRLKQERRILARLDHPNISRLIDGGTTAEGLPYFVMEYIEGKPLHVFCDEKRLSTIARLNLFLAVCSAVQYAHHALVIHRDLKPANILVTPDGVPKLLDFGIAKLLDPGSGAEATVGTILAFTPRYASPEQVRGDPLTTATDIYSLGFVLYEMLTGHGPYRLQTWSSWEVLRVIAEQEPELPSAAVYRTERVPTADGERQLALTPSSISRTRDGSPERLGSRLRGDLDAIVITALRKDPHRRYPSVAAVAADIHAYLEGRPVSARPDSALYRAGKFVRRNRWGVAAAAVILSLVVGSGANFIVQSRRVTRERDRAARTQKFLVDLFSVSDPGEARGSTVTAREVLDKGAEKIRHDLGAEPDARADLMETIAGVYNRLGLNAQAGELAREALVIRRQESGSDPKALAHTLNLLGSILMDKSDMAAAEVVYREALELRRRHYGDDSLEVAETMNNLGGVVDQLGRYDEADRLQQGSLERKRKLLGAEDASIASGLFNLGVGSYRRGDLRGAEVRLHQAFDIQRKVYGKDHPEVAYTLQALGVIYDETGRQDQAERTYRDALAIQRKVLGQDHPDIVTTLTNLANTLSHAGRLSDAESVLREALPMSRKVYGETVTDTAHVLSSLADVELQLGHIQAADRDAAEALSIFEKVLGVEHSDTASARVVHGRVFLALGRYAEAETELRSALARLEKEPGFEAVRGSARQALGQLYVAWKKPAEAAH